MSSESVFIHFPAAQRTADELLRSLSFFQSPAVHTDTSGVSQHVPLCLPPLPSPSHPSPLKSSPSPSTTPHQLSDRAELSSPFLWFPLRLSTFFSDCSPQICAEPLGSLKSFSLTIYHTQHRGGRVGGRSTHADRSGGGGVYWLPERVTEGGREKERETKSNMGATSECAAKTNTRGRQLSGGESLEQGRNH